MWQPARLAPPPPKFDGHRALWYPPRPPRQPHSWRPPDRWRGTRGDTSIKKAAAKAPIQASTEYRANSDIRAVSVRVIGADGANLGDLLLSEALRVAREADLDLVEVSPNAKPPVCRILDLGKFLYEKSKKDKEARKSQKVIEIKEFRLRPKTADHHRSFKVRDARKWLLDGMKVRVRIRFRGREITLPEVAHEDMREIIADLADVSHVESEALIEGRTMIMMLAPGIAKAPV